MTICMDDVGWCWAALTLSWSGMPEMVFSTSWMIACQVCWVVPAKEGTLQPWNTAHAHALGYRAVRDRFFVHSRLSRLGQNSTKLEKHTHPRC